MRANTHTVTANINGQRIEVLPRETLLQAALRKGLDFPNSCRVGGCGSCKCRLTAGEVKELTETGYLLSAEELQQRTILACQSVPRTDVELEVELPREVRGAIVAQERATHDITKLTVQLDEPFSYRPGQYTNLRLGDGPVRSYSFASPAPDAQGRVSFFVRKVDGGQLSPRLCDDDLAGVEVRLDGARGDFWLRPASAPLLFIAGGSGLSPILAMLQAAQAAGDTRPVTLLFGAREVRDLYALEELEAMAAAWPSPFRFVPVLSAAEHETSWDGARGLVTGELEAHLEPGAHAYLCGPPAMIDAAVSKLEQLGVRRQDIHADRFTTQADAAALGVIADQHAQPASLFDYAKYFLFHAVALIGAISLLLGGWYTTVTLLAIVALFSVGDHLSGDDTSTPVFKRPWILTLQLWSALPLLALIVFSALWSVTDTDTLGVGAWLGQLTGYDFLTARAMAGAGHHLSAAIMTGLLIGLIGTITAHELVHRTWDPISLFIGRALLAFSFDTSFAIEHVYGHHRYVSTTEDPATAPRGRSVYAHVAISTVRGNLSAWDIEAARLRKKGLGLLSVHNAFLRGHLMSLVLVALAFAMAGLGGALFFTVCALWGKALLEIVNYMEHYGMVRDPELPVQPRHSWNSNKRISSWGTFNLTRHSHHHAQGEVPYHELRPFPEAPMMVSGYLGTLVLTLIPPLWHALMTPKVLAWDRDFASPHERKLAARANERSGMQRFRQHAWP